MSRQTVANRQKKLKVQQAIEELQKTALELILDLQSDAVRELRRILRNPKAKDSDKIAASREVLKGVLSERFTIDPALTKKIHEYLDEEDLDHIVEEEE